MNITSTSPEQETDYIPVTLSEATGYNPYYDDLATNVHRVLPPVQLSREGLSEVHTAWFYTSERVGVQDWRFKVVRTHNPGTASITIKLAQKNLPAVVAAYRLEGESLKLTDSDLSSAGKEVLLRVTEMLESDYYIRHANGDASTGQLRSLAQEK